MDNDDARLIKLFESNRRDAFRELFARFYKPMVLAAKFYLKDHPEAEDIVQQFFLKFWEEKLFKKIKNSFRQYLHISIRNACFNHLERQKQHPQVEPDPDKVIELEQAIDFLLHNEERKIFEKAYNDLPPQSRKVFELVYFSNQSYNQAAGALNISINTVKSHLKNALKILRSSDLLNNYYSDRKKTDSSLTRS
jgi:RNA polymerase sigma-70 factor (family 1)